MCKQPFARNPPEGHPPPGDIFRQSRRDSPSGMASGTWPMTGDRPRGRR